VLVGQVELHGRSELYCHTAGMPRRRLAVVALALLVGCGGDDSAPERAPPAPSEPPASGRADAAASRTDRDWTRFGRDAQRSNHAPALLRGVRGLRRREVRLPGVVDSSPIYLHDVRVGGRRRDVFFVTTSYGRTLAIGAGSGRVLWQFAPPGIGGWEGSAQITQASPVADPSRRWIYSVSPDGKVHKLSVSRGREAGGRWPVSVTRDPGHEKIAPALNLSGRHVLVTTGGYLGDIPPYQGHVVSISRGSGRIANVFNALCSDRREIIDPNSCSSNFAAIWARSGAVVIPGSRRILVSTGNAPFDGSTDWGDSVLMLSAGAGRLLQSYTPESHAELEQTDADLGSTTPALVPEDRPRFGVQGGKDGVVRLLSLRRLNGTGSAGPRLGGEVQTFNPPNGELAFTAPAVSGSLVFTADEGGTVAYRLRGSRLGVLWRNDTPGTSPVVVGGLLLVYDQTGGGLNVYRARTGRSLANLPAGEGHWNSPIVGGGRIALPEGDANEHTTEGVLNIYGR
jgi:outer membrane protein assembly factor BamB